MPPNGHKGQMSRHYLPYHFAWTIDENSLLSLDFESKRLHQDQMGPLKIKKSKNWTRCHYQIDLANMTLLLIPDATVTNTHYVNYLPKLIVLFMFITPSPWFIR